MSNNDLININSYLEDISSKPKKQPMSYTVFCLLEGFLLTTVFRHIPETRQSVPLSSLIWGRHVTQNYV